MWNLCHLHKLNVLGLNRQLKPLAADYCFNWFVCGCDVKMRWLNNFTI